MKYRIGLIPYGSPECHFDAIELMPFHTKTTNAVQKDVQCPEKLLHFSLASIGIHLSARVDASPILPDPNRFECQIDCFVNTILIQVAEQKTTFFMCVCARFPSDLWIDWRSRKRICRSVCFIHTNAIHIHVHEQRHPRRHADLHP